MVSVSRGGWDTGVLAVDFVGPVGAGDEVAVGVGGRGDWYLRKRGRSSSSDLPGLAERMASLASIISVIWS